MISDAYPNLFAPAGVTFSIWGLIYLLLALYVAHQFISFGAGVEKKNEPLLSKINVLFTLTSLANISWIFAWHYDFILLSVLIMLVLLALLIRVADALQGETLSQREKLFVATPFFVYFGWITVATIANVTVFLVSIGWGGFGISETIWTSIILTVGAVIGTLRMRKDKNVAYGMVLIWAYLGILFKHLSPSGFDGQYPSILVTTLFCLLVFILVIVKVSKNNSYIHL